MYDVIVVMPVPPPRQLNKEGPSPGNLKGQVPLSKSLGLGDPIQGSKRGKGGGYLLCTGALVGEGAPRGRGGVCKRGPKPLGASEQNGEEAHRA